MANPEFDPFIRAVISLQKSKNTYKAFNRITTYLIEEEHRYITTQILSSLLKLGKCRTYYHSLLDTLVRCELLKIEKQKNTNIYIIKDRKLWGDVDKELTK